VSTKLFDFSAGKCHATVPDARASVMLSSLHYVNVPLLPGAVVLYKMQSGYSEEDVVIDPLIQQANAIGVEDLHSCISYQTICTTGERGTECYTGVNACMCVGNMYNGCWPLGGM